ncbi:MAG: PAS domain S-box protein [Candidatus Sabulitectum sp.]|nr:PAS domain S-box protein [Candidatus Sabulitectum sp.]
MREGGGTREQLILEIRELREHNSLLDAEILAQSNALSDLARFKTISDSAEHGNAITDLRGKLVYVNDYFAGKLGYTAEELLGKNLSIFHSEEQLKLVEKIIESITGCGKYGPMEIGHIHRDGSEFTMLMSGIFINDEGGKPAYLAASAIDITERKLAEKALRAERDKLKIIFSSIRDGIYIVDHEYNIEFVNPVLMADFGPHEGKKCHSYFHGSENSCPSCRLPDVLAGKTVPREWTSSISGKTYSMLDTPLKNADGSISKLEVLRDITDQKQSEETRILHLKFLENLNRIDAAIRKSTDVEQMMSDVLQATLEIFQSDRAWLLYPCDPDAKSWKVPMEHTRPEYPGALVLGKNLPMIPEVQAVCRRALKENDVITIDSREACAPKKTDKQFSTLSQMQIVLHPQAGKPWLFGLHQCSHFREWSKEETDLFREISHRLSDALSSLLLVRDLRESRENLNEAQRVAHIGSWSLDIVSNALTWAEETYRIFEMDPQQCSISFETFLNAVHPDDREFVSNAYTKSVSNRTPYDISHRLLMKDSRIKHVREMCETFYNDQGQPIRSIGTTQNITDIKNAEKKNQELQRQVQHTQKLESLGILAGGIAHDFNNILMAILGNADLALMALPTANPAYSNIRAIW